MMLFAPSDFFTALRKDLKQRLPTALRNFRTTRGRGRLMKVHFGEPAFHYEAWHHAGAGRLEVGLHFEASAVENQAAFDFFRSRMVEPHEGTLLYLLVKIAGAKRILELGTATGYSGIWMLRGSGGGTLTTYETDHDRAQRARANFGEAGFGKAAIVLEENAKDGLE